MQTLKLYDRDSMGALAPF